MTLFLLKKSIVNSQTHKSILDRARERILRQIELRRARNKPLELDSAHMETAFSHLLRRYPEDGLIRMGLLLRSDLYGHLSRSDAEILRHLPFRVADFLTWSPNKGHDFFHEQRKIYPEQLSDEQKAILKIPMPVLEQYLDFGPLSDVETKIRVLNELPLRHLNDIKYEVMRSSDKGKQYTQQEAADILYHPEFVRALRQYQIAKNNLLNPSTRRDSASTQKVLRAFQRSKDQIKNSFRDNDLKSYFDWEGNIERCIQTMKNAKEDSKDLAKLYKIREIYQKNPELSRYIEQLRHTGSRVRFARTRTKSRKSFEKLIGSYGLFDNPDNPSVMDYLEAFMPSATAAHSGGRYRKLYHLSYTKTGFPMFDPKRAGSGNHYGNGTFSTMITAIPRLFKNPSLANYFATLRIPQHFKFLWHDREYGRGKEGRELLSNINNYFDQIAERMNKPEFKGIFEKSLELARQVPPGAEYKYADKAIDTRNLRGSQIQQDETTDRYGYRGSVQLVHPEKLFCDATTGTNDELLRQLRGKYPSRYFEQIYPSHQVTVDKNEDGSQKIKIPGWLIHKAIKLAFEQMGATPSGHPIGSSNTSRSSSHHLSVLLSSLGYHGYMHFDPETRQWSVDHTSEDELHPDVAEERRQKGNTAKIIPTAFLKKLKTSVIFPAALADIPRLLWSRTVAGKQKQSDPISLDRDEMLRTSESIQDYIGEPVRQVKVNPTHDPGIFATRGAAGRFASARPAEMTRITPAPTISPTKPISTKLVLRADR